MLFTGTSNSLFVFMLKEKHKLAGQLFWLVVKSYAQQQIG